MDEKNILDLLELNTKQSETKMSSLQDTPLLYNFMAITEQ